MMPSVMVLFSDGGEVRFNFIGVCCRYCQGNKFTPFLFESPSVGDFIVLKEVIMFISLLT